MPPKSERLTKNDFSGLSKRNIIRGQYFDIGYVQATQTKVACIISTKTLKRAVDRNKVKRKMYKLFRECKPKKPYIILLYPKKDVLYTPYLQLKDTMSEVFAKL